MATYELVRVKEEGEEGVFLRYKDEAHWYGRITQDPARATLEELAEFCDHKAEDCNAHDFSGAHRLLAVVLFRRLGRGPATVILREIAVHGGLHGMNGVCGAPDAYGDYGLPDGGGHDWSAEEWSKARGEGER